MRRKTLMIRKTEIFTVITKGYKKKTLGFWKFKSTEEVFPEVLIFVKGQNKPWSIKYKTEDEMIKAHSELMDDLENKTYDFIDLSKYQK